MKFGDVEKEEKGKESLPEITAEKINREYTAPIYKEKADTIKLSVLQQNLGNCLQIIDDEVMRGYITRLNQLPIVEMDNGDINSLKDIHFFKVSELVYQKDEFSVHKLATVFGALSNKLCTLVLMIKSNGNQNDFYLGVRSEERQYSSGTMMQMLRQSLLGMFPGSKIETYYDDEMKKDMQQLSAGSVSCVTCVADYKQDRDILNNQEFMQGLDNFIYSMSGKAYTAIFLAVNLRHDDLMYKKQELENIYTQISPFSNMQLNFTVTNSQGISNGQSMGVTQSSSYGMTRGTSENVTIGSSKTIGSNESYGMTDTKGMNKSVSDGITDTEGYSDGVSESVSNSHTNGTFNNASVSKGFKYANVSASHGVSSSDTRTTSHGTSHTDSVSQSISKTLSHGINTSHTDSLSKGINESRSNLVNYSIGAQNGETYNAGEAFNLIDSKTLTDTFGNSQGITLPAQNMTLLSALKKIETHLNRIEECESLGMWQFAAYFLAESSAESETAANVYKSIVSGNQSGIERAAVNTWIGDQEVKALSVYMENFVHPQFLYGRYDYDENMVLVNPAAMVSTNELAIHMGLPRHSVKGLAVTEHASFAQEVLRLGKNFENSIKLGKIYHLGEKKDTDVEIDVDSMTMHTFVTGSTGSGKSNAVYGILKEIEKKGIPFLVVEPAKGEYRNVFNHIHYFGTNPKIGEMIQINPFSFPGEIHILEHIDRIIEIFNVCWPMYAAMPAVLKESIERAYISAGWDMELSINSKIPDLFPTFDDVLAELKNTISSSDYSVDTKGDYIGSLSTRIQSLTNGINGRIFSGNETDLKYLFDQSAILDLSRVGSMETKSLIMGLVVLKLQEYRLSHVSEMNAGLKHITVLEEAHNLLKKTSTEQSQDSSNLLGKSVEMLTNTVAEIRTYGEGFIIVDQAPNLLDTAVIRNTNTKIVLRLPEGNDRTITGAAMALNENQLTELSKLPTGVAAVYQNDWQEAVLCRLPKFEIDNTTFQSKRKTMSSERKPANKLLHMLLKKSYSEDEKENIKKTVILENLSAKVRRVLITDLEKRGIHFEWAMADYIKKNYYLENIFDGTQSGECKTLEQLYLVMKDNIISEFEEFSENEMKQIMYYICRIEHERFPQNTAIELLRTEYLKKEMGFG